MQLFRPADILIPATDMHAWSVVACDQFTSEPEYWARVHEIVGDKPSALRLILPEAELGIKNPEEESKKINAAMADYLDGGVFKEYKNSYVYVERRLCGGMVRRGIVGAFDLEAYDWAEGTHTPIRATEHTVEDRLPPRVKVRESALIEMPHIMVFMDDHDDAVLSSVKKGDKLYDFELMLGGGHISGWLVDDNAELEKALEQLADPQKLADKYGTAKNPIIFAMGDGNHSFAAAKKHWESVKSKLPESEWADCPARYALAELVNIHDEAISFEPIHKVIFDTEPESFINEAKSFFSENAGDGRSFTLITSAGSESISVSGMSIGELIDRCESFCREYIARHGGRIDYIHGDDECKAMSKREGCAGILLPRMEKSELFKSVMSSGPFPKKSFSIGVGRDKRYYLECRRIK